MNAQHILFVSQRYHPYVGGVETQTRLMAQELSRTHQVSVIAPTLGHHTVPRRLRVLEDSLLLPTHEPYVDEGVPVHTVPLTLAERLRMLPCAVRALPRVQRHRYHELRRFAYRHYRAVMGPKLQPILRGADVVHTVSANYLGWAAREVAHAQGTPFVCTPYVHPGAWGDDADSVAFYNQCDAVFALLDTDRQYLEEIGVEPERIRISGVVPLLPPTADAEGFRARHGLGTDPVILYVGRVVEYKGAPHLMEAMKQVWTAHPRAHLLFVGPVAEEGQAWIESLGDSRLRALGRVSEQEKADALAACDLFAMPSRAEILPAVYLEAWSYGKPVLGGPANGLDALIEGNDAGLVADQEAGSIAERLNQLLGRADLRARLGQNGQRVVEERYSVGALRATFEGVYEEVIAARRPMTSA
ncbi:MAG: glycosyltransferase family 4 protein [Bacteroidota bacterium]